MHNVGTSIEHWTENPQLYFADLDADVTAALVAASADLALVIDAQGVIRDLTVRSAQRSELAELRLWIGRRWIETVSVESRVKITALIEAASVSRTARRAVELGVASGARAARVVARLAAAAAAASIKVFLHAHTGVA